MVKNITRPSGKGSYGFTLIELLIALAILGFLSAIAVLSVAQFRAAGELEAAQSELKIVRESVAAFMNNSDGEFPTSDGGPGDISLDAEDGKGMKFSDYFVRGSDGFGYGPYFIDGDGVVQSEYFES
jgi:prepilin-type N-terminal cleavage/methylation domain-containing protein